MTSYQVVTADNGHGFVDIVIYKTTSETTYTLSLTDEFPAIRQSIGHGNTPIVTVAYELLPELSQAVDALADALHSIAGTAAINHKRETS